MHLSTGQPFVFERECPGKGYSIRVNKLDPNIWAKVKEILLDEPKFQRMVKGTSAQLEEEHIDAVRRLEMIEKELSDTRDRAARLFDRMNNEKDEGIYAMQHAELKRLNMTAADLEKHVKGAKAEATGTQRRRNYHEDLIARVKQSVARYRANSAQQAGMQEALEGLGYDPAKHMELRRT